MKPKIKKIDAINKLNNESVALHAQMFHAAFFAHSELTSMSKMNFTASAVIITITNLSGKVLMQPVAVRDGLSLDTVKALQADIKRSQKGLKDFDLNKDELK